MKNKFLSVALACMLLLCGSAKADNVDLIKARQVGAFYFSVATGAKAPIQADQLELAQQFDNPTLCIPALYAFNVADDGFVVVSASDAIEPVLAYSPTGNLNPESLNPAAQYMLDSYAKLISANQNSEAKSTPKIQAMWKELENKTFTCDLSKAGVLIQTRWGQGENSRATYNCFCPTVGGKYTYAGCVATAMSQIIKYWNYPERGGQSEQNSVAVCSWNNSTVRYKFLVDSNKFVFDSMPNTISYTSPWNNKRAIGKLMFACGVTVQMGWGVDGSGAVSQNVPSALSTWFKYSNNARYISRSHISDDEWVNMLQSEIVDNMRPVYYSGYDGTSQGRDAGHAWVVCGASAASRTKFYINWGWDGSSNGFYTLAPISAIGNAGGYTFNSSHAMVYQIYPKSTSIDEASLSSISPAYPNPASDFIIIPADLPNNAAMAVYSLDGRMVERVIIPAGTKEYQLNLQHYAAGTYVYRLNGSMHKFTVL